MDLIDVIEHHDWNVSNNDNNQDKYSKSISSYYLNNWYDKVKDITFDTVIYEINNDINDTCPEILPFEKCMIRYENKSPKDSEYWGPVNTKEQIVNIFYTSLRCKTNKGKYLCIRKWVDNIKKEFRCFFNKKLVAVASVDDEDPPFKLIINYVSKIQNLIPYYRCVFDLALINDELIFIEFNSWETNSGAHLFDWVNDTEVFYDNPNKVIFKWSKGSKEIECEQLNKPINILGLNIYNNSDNLNNLKILKPNKPSKWLITDKYLYVCNDIYLGRFTHSLKPINWKRGNFRFSEIQLCENDVLLINNIYYHYDLTVLNKKYKIINDYEKDDYDEHEFLKYGFYCKFINDFGNQLYFNSLNYDGSFTLIRV